MLGKIFNRHIVRNPVSDEKAFAKYQTRRHPPIARVTHIWSNTNASIKTTPLQQKLLKNRDVQTLKFDNHWLENYLNNEKEQKEKKE